MLLDEINFAEKEVLEYIQKNLDNKDCNRKSYVNIPIHKFFNNCKVKFK